MIMLILWTACVFSLFVICRVDWSLLKQGLPSLGVIVTLMYISTYGAGLTFWRFDPSSLFGYATFSTIGSLDRMAFLLSLGLPVLVISYSVISLSTRLLLCEYPCRSLLSIANQNRCLLQRLCFLLLILSVLGVFGMTASGLFLRDPEQQKYALDSSLIAKLLVGSGLLSRLAPVGLVLVPFSWSSWQRWMKLASLFILSVWAVLAIASASRGQVLALPLYLLIGGLVWRRLSVRSVVVLLLFGSIAFLPLAEAIRINREGDASQPSLSSTFQSFQIGKQLIGTSHDFYLMLSAADCSTDLIDEVAKHPSSLKLSLESQSNYPANSEQRWHHVFLYKNCIDRVVSRRAFAGYSGLLHVYLPKTIFPDAPSLFDGQSLVEAISDQLGLRPGEISQGTLSVFADAWWRWRWAGVLAVSALLGAILAFIQSLLLWILRHQPMAGLLGQLLAISLVGTWINNTTLTMLWFLLWDLPKAWLELLVFSAVLRVRLPRGTT